MKGTISIILKRIILPFILFIQVTGYNLEFQSIKQTNLCYNTFSINTIDIASNLAGWWKFEEETGTILYDSSGNNFNGYIYGAEWIGSDKNKKMLRFDGKNDYVKINWKSPIQGEKESFTIYCLVKTESTDGNHWIVGDDSGFKRFILGLLDGKLYLHWRYGDSWEKFYLNTNKAITGDFVHIAVTYNSKTRDVVVYINGKLSHQNTTSKPLGIKDIDTLLIGAGYWAANMEYYEGIIDEIIIYNRTLQANEIAALYYGERPSFSNHKLVVPEDLTGAAISCKQVNLYWSYPIDNDILLFKIYRDNVLLGLSFNKNFKDIATLPDTQYTYTVEAIDYSWNKSPKSKSYTLITPGDTFPPDGYFYCEMKDKNKIIVYSIISDHESGMGKGALMKFSLDGKKWTDEETYSSTKNLYAKSLQDVESVYALYSDPIGNWTKIMNYSFEAGPDTDFTILKNAPGSVHLKWKKKKGIKEYIILKSEILGYQGSIKLLKDITPGDQESNSVLKIESTDWLNVGDQFHINNSREDYYIADVIDNTHIRLTYPIQRKYKAGSIVQLSASWIKDYSSYKEIARFKNTFDYLDTKIEVEKDYYYMIAYKNKTGSLYYSNPKHVLLTENNIFFDAALGSNGGYAWKASQYYSDTPELIDGNPDTYSKRIQCNNPLIKEPETISRGFHRVNLHDRCKIKRIQISQNMNPSYIQASEIRIGFDNGSFLAYTLENDSSIIIRNHADYRIYTIGIKDVVSSYVSIYIDNLINKKGKYIIWNTISIYTDEIINNPITSAQDLKSTSISIDFGKKDGKLPVLFGTDEVFNNIEGLENGFMLNTWPYTSKLFNLYRIQMGDTWPRSYGYDLIQIGVLQENFSKTHTTLKITKSDPYLKHLFYKHRIKIDNELMISSGQEGNDLIVQRGYEWTSVVPHKKGSPVYAYKKAGQILRLQEIIPEFRTIKYPDAYVSGIQPISREYRSHMPGYVDLNNPKRTEIVEIVVNSGEYIPGDVIKIGMEKFLINAITHKSHNKTLLTARRGYDGTNLRTIQQNPPVSDIYKLIDYEPYYKKFKNDPSSPSNYYWDNLKFTLDKIIKKGKAVPWIIVYSPRYATQSRGRIYAIESVKNPGGIRNSVIIDEYNMENPMKGWWYYISPANKDGDHINIRGNMYEYYHAQLHMLTGKAAGKVYFIRSHTRDKLILVKTVEDSYWTKNNPVFVDLEKEGIRPGDVYLVTHPANKVANVAPKYWQYNADIFYNIAKYIRDTYSKELHNIPIYMEYYLEPNLQAFGTWTKDAYINSYNIFANTIRNGGPHFSIGFHKNEVIVGAGSIGGGLNPAIKMSGSSGDYDLALSLIERAPVLDFISHHRYYVGNRIQKRENPWEYWMLKTYAQTFGKKIGIIDSEDSVATAGGTGKEEARHWAQYSVPYWFSNFINSYNGDYGESGRLDFMIHFRLYYANENGFGLAAADRDGKPILDLVYWPLKLFRDNTSSVHESPDIIVKTIKGGDNFGWIQSMGTIHGITGEKKIHIVNKKGEPIDVRLELLNANFHNAYMESVIGGGPNKTITDGYHPINYKGYKNKGTIIKTIINNSNLITIEPYSANIITLQ